MLCIQALTNSKLPLHLRISPYLIGMEAKKKGIRRGREKRIKGERFPLDINAKACYASTVQTQGNFQDQSAIIALAQGREGSKAMKIQATANQISRVRKGSGGCSDPCDQCGHTIKEGDIVARVHHPYLSGSLLGRVCNPCSLEIERSVTRG